MNTYNSMKEFQDAVYNAALAKKSLNSMCSAQCKKGTVKSKVRSSRDSGSSINMTSSNLNSVSQNYLNSNMKITKVVDRTLELSENDDVTVTCKKISSSSSSKVCNATIAKSFSITGNVSYGAADVTATASYDSTVNTTTTTSSSTYNEDTVTYRFHGANQTVQLYYNNYICTDTPTLDVTYNFDTITISAACKYEGDTGIIWLSGAERGESRTYNLADLGFSGPVNIKTPVSFNVNCNDEWMSKDIL